MQFINLDGEFSDPPQPRVLYIFNSISEGFLSLHGPISMAFGINRNNPFTFD